jgi:hypothetical protein
VGLCRLERDKGEEMAEGGSRETAKEEDVGVVATATATVGDCCTLHALLGEAGSTNRGPPFKERR